MISERRAALGLEAAWVGRETGVDEETVGRWERGETVPSRANLARLSALLQVHMEDLFALAGHVSGQDEPDVGPGAFTP